MSWRGLLVVAMLGFLVTPLRVLGIQGDPMMEGRMLRSASSLESRGDYTGAEDVLRQLMDARPTSAGGLFALERVLRAQGRLIDVLGTVDAFLRVEPTAAAARILELRVLSDADSTRALAEAAETWIDTDPESPDVYREVARVFAPVFGERRARDVLFRGREAVGDPGVFAMEIGDLHRDLGQLESAVREWSRAVGDDGAQVASVTRRLRALPGDVGVLAKPLVDLLGDAPTTVARQRAGARIALEVGLREEALELAKAASARLAGRTRRGFLADLARRAEEREAHTVALWAYESLMDQGAGASETRSLDQQIASIALAMGDTARALSARRRLAASLALGSRERRRALAEVLRLVIARSTDEGDRLLRVFSEEYPEAPELDALVVSLASRFQEKGNASQAEALLAGVKGPRSALERGYLHLAERNVEEGRAALVEALPGLAPSEATSVIDLLALLERLEGDPQVDVAWAMAIARQGRGEEALQALERDVEIVAEEHRPSVLAQAARVAEHVGNDEAAARLRARIVEHHPDAIEAGEAVFHLARFRARSADGKPSAMRLLEELILSRPSSPVAPLARRELERLKRLEGDT